MRQSCGRWPTELGSRDAYGSPSGSRTGAPGALPRGTRLVLPSLIEGFGLPVLEAMARGCPVACSDRPALPEVARCGAAVRPGRPERGDGCRAPGAWRRGPAQASCRPGARPVCGSSPGAHRRATLRAIADPRRVACGDRGEPRTLLVARGHQATPWELRPWELLPRERFEVAYLRLAATRSTRGPRACAGSREAVSDYRPRGGWGPTTGVHRATAISARTRSSPEPTSSTPPSFRSGSRPRLRVARREHGYKLVLTVWETIPFLDAYRNRLARKSGAGGWRRPTSFSPATERARRALLLGGRRAARIEVVLPGHRHRAFCGAPRPEPPPRSSGDVARPARLGEGPPGRDACGGGDPARGRAGGRPSAAALLIVGAGPEEARLRAYAESSGSGTRSSSARPRTTRCRTLYARASCIVLASLATASGGFWLGDGRVSSGRSSLASCSPRRLRPACRSSRRGPARSRRCAATRPTLSSRTLDGAARLLAAGPLARRPATRSGTSRPVAALLDRGDGGAARGRLRPGGYARAD